MNRLEEYRKAKDHLANVREASRLKISLRDTDGAVQHTFMAATEMVTSAIWDNAIALAETQVITALRAAETEAQDVLEAISEIRSRKAGDGG